MYSPVNPISFSVKPVLSRIDLIAKLFDEIATKYEGRVGGYTRILKIGQRRGDAAEVVRLELI